MKPLTLTIYQSSDGWRWRLKAANGRIVADGGEAYKSRANAIRAARRLQTALIVVDPVPGVEPSRQHISS
jgi:uncharacterized protein YegP (UPF0339 family)